MKILKTILILVITLNGIHAKVYSKCELAKKLKASGIAVNKLPDWMCLVKYESNYNSSLRGPKNKNGSYDWGIFQVNDKYWCKNGSKPGNDCNIKCSSKTFKNILIITEEIFFVIGLINDDISDDITCAKKIYARHGFNAWYGWKNKCKGKDLSSFSVKSCGL